MRTATAAELTFRTGSPADTDRILDLVKLSLGEGLIPRGRAYWEWKHQLNPFGQSPILLAEAEGMLVGLRVFMPWEWEAGRRCYRAVRAVDTATHPEWQGRGIFSRLTLMLLERMREAGVDFVFNTPNARSRPGYLKMGWQSVGRTSLWICPVRPLCLLRGALRRPAGGHAADPEVAVCAPFPSAGEVLQRPESVSLLEKVRAASADPRLATPRSFEYLLWRYASVPGFRYHALAELDDGEGAALIFRYKQHGSLLELRLCEVLTIPTPRSRAIARSLLGRLRRHGGADYLAGMAAPGTPEQRVLLAAHFLPTPRVGPILTVRPLHEDLHRVDPTQRRGWRLSIGDLELF